MKEYKVELTELAQEDLQRAKEFYDLQADFLRNYFIDSIFIDLESLRFYGGIHNRVYGFYKMLAKRFPYAIYYEIEEDKVVVHAILDTRQNPLKVKKRLK